MSNQMLSELHAIMSANARAAGMIAIIDGYTLFQNSEVGPYVGLYNSRRNLREGRVYVNDHDGDGHSYEFKKLPRYIQSAVAESISQETPLEAPRSEGREAIEQKGFMRKCQPFKIVRFQYPAKDGENQPWRIERCFPIGRANSATDREAQPTQPRVQPEPQPEPKSEASQPEKAPGRDALIAELWALLPTIYKNWKVQSAKIVEGMTGGKQNKVGSLSDGDLCVFRAIVLLDQLGMGAYGNDWYSILAGQVEEMGYENVYGVPVDKLRRIYTTIKIAAEPSTASRNQ